MKNKKLDFDHNLVTMDLIINNGNLDNGTFKEVIIKYLTKNLLSLQEIIEKTSLYILNQYNVSLLDTFSTSSLAMKIFKTDYLEKEILILPPFYGEILRQAYKGGMINIIKPKGKNLRYYDINSLYPYAMKNFMLEKMLKKIHDPKINLKDFFGFVYAQVVIPKSVKVSFAHIKTDHLIAPVGKIKGLFFSEKLKAFQRRGYTVNPILGFEHEKIRPFDKYVDHLYEIKKEAKGGKRMIIKLL